MRLPFQKVTEEEIQKMFEDKSQPGPFDDEYVVLDHINKVYGNGFHAVYDFNLTIKKNEFIVFVGPSGCGKSTTLRMIAGLEDISSGTLTINGEEANDLLPKDRDVAMVFQNYALYPNMTVFKNMAFSLYMRHFPNNVIRERVEEAAKILEISDQLLKKPKELSGGQRQRVALGRAIVRNARIFLMDEPLSNLDAKLRVQMRSEIINLHKKLKATTIYVTHDQTEAMTMADRIVVMKRGYVQQIGAPKEIYLHPANVFVASFIGSPAMNIIKCTYSGGKLVFADGQQIKLPEDAIKKHDEYYRKQYAEESRDLPLFKEELDRELAEFNKKRHKEKDVEEFKAKYEKLQKEKKGYLSYLESAMRGEEHEITFGIRPEAIEQTEKDGEGALNTEVKLSEMLGEEYFVHFDFGGKDVLAKVFTEKTIETGSAIKLKIRKDKIHLFDSISENSIL